MNAPALRLTSLAHGGGCGCKLAPSVLRELLAGQPATAPFANLIVGTETGDDAAVWRLDDETNIVATTDFFMPMVDDPYDFGRIAATNALSDVYAMGGRPIFALAILGMPIDKMPTAMIREILARRRGGRGGGGNSGRRRPFDRFARADLRARRHRPRRAARGCGATADARARRRADPHQADRRRHLLGRDQEGRALRRGLPRDDRLHDAAQRRRRGAGEGRRAFTRSPT